MSTLMEDRLTAALRARADLVQPEDLRPVDVPAVSLEARRGRAARRRRLVVLAGLAAAACAAVVAGPLLLSDTGGNGSPQPAGPTEPRPTSSTQRPQPGLTADVDGDGQDDEVQLSGPQGQSYEVRVAFAGGDQAGLDLTFGPSLRLWTTEDLDGDGSHEVLLRGSDEHAFTPLVVRSTGSGGLALATFPMAELQGWTPDSPRNEWAVIDGRLRTYRAPTGDAAEVPLWSWSLRGEQLEMDGKEIWCLADGSGEPAPCPGTTDADGSAGGTGAHGGLPKLLPAVEEVLAGERFYYTPYQYGDYAQLQGDLGEQSGAVEDGQAELVVTVNGEEHRVGVPAGQSPWLVPQPLAVHGDAPVFVTLQSGGDTSLARVWSFWNGDLVEIESRGDVFLGSGFVDRQGEMAEQRTWVTHNGQLFTAILLDAGTGRHQLWRWDMGGQTITPTDLGEVCIDWRTQGYGRCAR
jgi:hypothetical protein